jgi:lysophospholipase L1-like esterase
MANKPIKFPVLTYLLFLFVFTLISLEVILRGLKINASWEEITGNHYATYYGQKLPTWFNAWSPNQEFEMDHGDFKYHYKTNSLGLREKENFFQDTGKTKIVCIGDSYTEGVGAPYDSSYPRFLERAFIDSGFNCEIMDAGASGSDPFYEYMLYREKLAKYHPNYLLLQVNQSDITDYIYRGGFERFKPDGSTTNRKGPWYLGLYHYSYIVRYLSDSWPGHNLTSQFITRDEFDTVYAPQAISEIAKAIDTISALTRQNNCKLMVILQPIASDVAYDNDINTATANRFITLQQHAQKSGICCVNLWPSLKLKINPQNKDKFSWYRDAHYNSAGYKLFTEALLQEITSKYPGFWNGVKRTGQ